MRVITGKARGKRLAALDGNDVRPTTDRVKEALFDILQFRIEGRRFLDMFAGSGQIGIEALSRGAKSAVFIDSSKDSVKVIEKNIDSSGVSSDAKVICADAVHYVSSTADVFDVAFIDPPYYSEILLTALEKAAAVMPKTGVIICEHLKEANLPEIVGDFKKIKEYRYGRVFLTRYECE